MVAGCDPIKGHFHRSEKQKGCFESRWIKAQLNKVYIDFRVQNVKGYEFVRNDSKCCWCWYCRENIIRILIKMDVRQNLN